MLNKLVMTHFEVLLQILPGNIKGNHQTSQPGCSVYRTRFEIVTSRIRRNNSTRFTATLIPWL